MSFVEAVSACFSKYATFRGRASRSEFWYFSLFIVLVMIGATILDAALFPHGRSLFPSILGLVILLPSIAVLVRRLHDTDRSGWWYWISFVPLIGTIVLFVFAVQRGTPGQNSYG
ncbi:MAG TPA: DUF805 domain-containing protein [Geminicoccus sp.]|jgi:uncharacterized membrane protein YhaH (DUF805 family)|uniref:DUF805 domain-containing protein n=1 Tax=Geminicoccus sp. TaxID=2024832 RepID=UPI002E32A2E9|nr:DUF805 domain-containing protein [Geminicoccus sp.]HEX2526997.1 DUF805 domain-containing protein [Geminicoccus sp.]